MLLSTLAAYCHKGCLSCTPENECLYCDARQFYKLVGGRCVAFPIDNCAQMDEKGRCVTCADNYYVDPVQFSCIALPNSFIVTNCAIHLGPKDCSFCKTGFVLKNGVCEANSNVIANCTYQNSKGKCLSCASGNMLNVSRTACIDIPKIEKCLTYSNIGCNSCNSGYLFNPNRYLNIILGFKNADQLRSLNTFVSDEINVVPDSSVFKVCESITLTDCSNVISNDMCGRCAPGYYLTYNNKCAPNPLPAIPNCNKYATATVCVDCKQGFFLENGSKCMEVTPLINCLIYDTDTQYSSCKKCIDEYYLNADNICMPRTSLSKIDLCFKLADEGESCEECLTGYTYTNDKLKCLPIVENCHIYVKSTINTLRLQCSNCHPGYYFNTTYKVCSKGTVENCQLYNQNSNDCAVCKPNFYLVSNTCLPHNQLPSCTNYSRTDADTCVGCLTFTFLFNVTNNCVSVDVIDQCKRYASKTTCNLCNDGFYLYNPSECRAIPPELNCRQLNAAGACIKCLNSYVLDSGLCFEPQQYIVKNCENTNVNGTVSSSKLKCNFCRPNHIPINYRDSFVCQDKDYIKIKYLAAQQQFDNNCSQFIINSTTGALECVRCNDNFVIEGLTCVQSCTNSTRTTVYKQYVEVYDIDGNTIPDSMRVIRTNVCNTTIPNCATAVPNLNTSFDSPTYACVECFPGFFKTISVGGTAGIYMRPGKRYELLYSEYGTSPITVGPGVQCIKTDANIKVIGEPNTSTYIDNCEYFQMIFPKLYACNKCNWGMTGTVMDLIKNCSIYSDSQTCTKCQVGYFLESNKECLPVLDILNCVTYDSSANSTVCLECSPDFYVNANSCTQRVNSLNVMYGTVTLTADNVTCNAGYIKDTAIVPHSCKQLPFNCITATITASVITCTECKRNTSYLDISANCVDGTIANCSNYFIGDNKCHTCVNGFYKVSDTVCAPHITVNDTYCDTWDQSTKNLCATCQFNAVRLQIENKCLDPYTIITNCSEYVDIYTCKTCAAGHYLDNLGRTCMAIPADLNCDTYTPIDINSDSVWNTDDQTDNKKFLYTCTKCKVGYFRKTASVTVNLLAGGTSTKTVATCYPYLEFARERCEETDVNGLVDFGGKYCAGCDATYFPYDFDNKYVCVEKDYIKLKDNTVDANCTLFSYDGANALKCLRCKFGYFLKISAGAYTNVCEQTCTNTGVAPADTLVPYIHNFSVTSGVISFETGVCKDSTDVSQTNTKGAYYATGVKLADGTFSTVISKCVSDYIPVLTYVATDYYRTFINPNGSSFKISSPFDGYPSVKTCIDQTSVTIRGHILNSVVVPNCEYYHQLDATTYGCMKCKFGYTGRIKGYTSGTQTNYGSIEYCEAFSGCDTSIISGMYTSTSSSATNGLLNRYFSCFKCSTSTDVLISAVAGASTPATPATDFVAIYGLREYKLSTATTTEAYTENVASLSDSYSNFCTPSANLPTTLDLESTNLVIINCAAYYLNIDSTGLDTDIGLVCAACLPGYYPTYDATLTFRITDCTAITNCNILSAGNTLNRCMSCVQNYDVYNDNVDYTICRDVSSGVLSVTSCFAGSDDSNCSICRAGYELGKTISGETKCFQLNVPRCSKVNYYDDFSSNYALSSSVMDTAMYLYSGNASTNQITGCTACTDANDVLVLNKVASNAEVDPKVCVGGLLDTIRTDSVSNCTRVGWDYTNSKYVCRECAAHYLLTSGNECTPVDAVRLPNCKIAKEMDSDFCVECSAAQYVIVGGVCLDKSAGTLPVGLVADCATYTAGTKDLAMGVCQLCDATYYLDSNTCISIPDPNCSSYTSANGCLACKNNHALFKLDGRNVCIDLDANDDSIWDYDTNCDDIIVDDGDASTEDIQTKYLNCKKCKSQKVLSAVDADIPMKSKCTNIVLAADAQCISYDVQTLLSNSKLYCTACSNYTTHYLSPFTKLCTARTAITNCNTYSNNSDRCDACSPNYSLNFAKTACLSLTADIGNRAINKGYIHTCRDMPTCNTGVFYEGLEADLTSYFSCHACKKTDEIPFVAVRTDDAENRIESLNEYGFNSLTTDPLQKGTGGQAVQCLKPANTNFNIALSANFVFPSNCGLGLIKVNYAPNALKSSAASTDMDKSTVMCAACKPGFKATRALLSDNTKVRYMAAICTTIANCEFSRWFNACTQCQAGYSYSYNLTTGINYDECVSYTENPQCLAVHVSAAVKTCKSCKKGSFLNKDGNCDLINPPRCEYDRFKFNSVLPSKDLFGGIFDINDGVGCNQCVDGFAAVYAKNDDFVCTESLYLVSATLSVNTFYILNCLNYTNDPLGVLRCAVCKTNFTVTQDGKCVAASTIPNCILAQSDSVCLTCASKYVLVNRKCETPNITDCVVYHDDILGFEQVCKTCEPGYYVAGNKCVKGQVANCKVNETGTKCDECMEGFSLVLANGEKNFCFPNSSKLNCRRFDIAKFQAGTLECVECINNSYVISTSKTDFKPTFCMPFTDQDKCEVFNNNPLILSDSSFECQRCSANYFLNQGVCVKRTIKPSQCTVYQIEADKCIECAYGYHPANNGILCSPYPEGIKGCVSYKSKGKCDQCDVKMYLRDNSCITVDTEIPNCSYYDDKDVCGTCANGFVNIKGKCVAAYAQSCVTYASLTECKTCVAGYGLKSDGKLLNCVQKNISNCSVSEDMEPFNCLVCSGDNYPLNGVCTSVATKIENCIQYDSAGNCAVCSNRTALSLDKRGCDNSPDTVAQVDPNCVNSTLLDAPVCNTCQHGYYFKFGLCQPCDADIMENGCYNCDPYRPNKCLMCSSGYYMSAEGDCVNLDTITESEGRIEGPFAAMMIQVGHALYE